MKLLEVGEQRKSALDTGGDSRPAPACLLPRPEHMIVEQGRTVAGIIRGLVKRWGTADRAITQSPGPGRHHPRKLQLPSQEPDRTIARRIVFVVQAGKLHHESLENVDLDYMITDVLEKERQFEVLLVAVKRDIINKLHLGPLLALLLQRRRTWSRGSSTSILRAENTVRAELTAERESGGGFALVNIGRATPA